MYIKKGIWNICKHHHAFAFAEFTDKGNSCYKPYRDDNPTTLNPLIAAVRTDMPKYGTLHKKLSACVASDLNIKWVSYDNLVKITARILDGVSSEDDIESLAKIAALVKV